MKILNEIYSIIEEHRGSKSSWLMAKAVLSACTTSYDGPSLLSVSVNLDNENQERVFKLMRIHEESDYSNAAQNEMFDKVICLYPSLEILD